MKFLDWLTGRSGEARSLTNPTTAPNMLAAEWWGLGSRPSATGLHVTPENALTNTAVWAAVRLISSSVATLPLHVYQTTKDGGRHRAPEQPADYLLSQRPNPEMSSFTFREMLLAHLLLWGNGYAEIERNGRGDPVALWPLLPWNVQVDRIDGEKVYRVSVGTEQVTLPASDVLHIPGFGIDGQAGLIPALMGKEAVALSKATEQFGASFFGAGAAPSGVLTHPAKLSPEGAKNLRESWSKVHSGLSNAHRVAILEEGMSFTPLGIPPEAAQFIATRQFQLGEVARLFGVPPHLIGDLDRATFSNIEAQGIEFVRYCLEPWTHRIEQEINYKLFGSDRSFFCEFSLEGLLRGDSAARAAWYTAMMNLGVYSINEVRQLENMNPVEGGDERFVPLNMGRLGQPQPQKEAA